MPRTRFRFTNPIAVDDSEATTRPLDPALRQEFWATRLWVIASVIFNSITVLHIPAQILLFRESTARSKTSVVVEWTSSPEVKSGRPTDTFRTSPF